MPGKVNRTWAIRRRIPDSQAILFQVVSRDEWHIARKEVLAKEQAAIKATDECRVQLRSDFPMVKLEKEYIFEGPDGKVSLSDLFKGRRQRIVSHLMLGPDDSAGCNGYRFVADILPSTLGHLNSRDTTLVLVSRAPLEKNQENRKRMGRNFQWYSSLGSDFNFDFHVTLDPDVAVPEFNYKSADPQRR